MALATNTRDLTGRSTVAGLFADRSHAQQAIADLKAAGFEEEHIGVAMRDRNEQGMLAEDSGVHGTHAGSGAATGGVVGGVLGLLVGIGALAIPGIGPVITAGVLAHAIGAGAAGVAIGAVGGGVVGALIGLGIPEHEAKHFETGFNAGGALVTVTAGPRASEAIEIMERDGGDTGASAYQSPGVDEMASGAYTMPAMSAPAMSAPGAGYDDIEATQVMPASAIPTASNVRANNQTPMGSDYKTAAPQGGQNMELHEEVLSAHTDKVQTGGVTLRKEVITEMKTIDVPVRREEVVIERHAVTGQAAVNADFSGTEEVLRVPVMEEQVVVQKNAVVTEEISLGKREVTETQHVTDTVRREEAYIENPNSVDVLERGAAASTTDTRTNNS